MVDMPLNQIKQNLWIKIFHLLRRCFVLNYLLSFESIFKWDISCNLFWQICFVLNKWLGTLNVFYQARQAVERLLQSVFWSHETFLPNMIFVRLFINCSCLKTSTLCFVILLVLQATFWNWIYKQVLWTTVRDRHLFTK